MKLWLYLLAAGALVAGTFGTMYVLGSHPGGERSGVLSKTAWQRMALPGAFEPKSEIHVQFIAYRIGGAKARGKLVFATIRA